MEAGFHQEVLPDNMLLRNFIVITSKQQQLVETYTLDLLVSACMLRLRRQTTSLRFTSISSTSLAFSLIIRTSGISTSVYLPRLIRRSGWRYIADEHWQSGRSACSSEYGIIRILEESSPEVPELLRKLRHRCHRGGQSS